MQSATGRATRVSILRYRANWQAGPLHYLRLLRELRLRARYRRSRPSWEALPPHVSSSWIEIVQAEAHPRLVLCPKSTYARLAERKPSIVFECDDWMPLSISLASLLLALPTPVLTSKRQSHMRMFRDRVPHLFRRCGHGEIPYPKGRKRIDQRVHYRCRRTDRSRLATALGAKRVVRA